MVTVQLIIGIYKENEGEKICVKYEYRTIESEKALRVLVSRKRELHCYNKHVNIDNRSGRMIIKESVSNQFTR